MADDDSQPGRAAPQLPELTQERHDANEDDLQAGLLGLAGIVVGALTVDEVLTEVAGFAAHAIPGVDAASVTLAHPSEERSGIRVWAPSSEFIRDIDTLQYDVHNEGPCITTMRTRQPCVSGAIGDDAHWRRFGPAVARLGVKSALSVPLMLGEQVIGAINAYAYSPDAFAEHAVVMGAKFAGPAAVSVHNARVLMEARYQAEQLQHALNSRSIIDQAIGVIRGRSGASAKEAFGQLVRISQAQNIKLAVLAERLVEESVARARRDRA